MITAVILSLNQKFPVVVFILAESTSGEIDLTLESGSWNAEYGLNFTAITDILQPFGEDVLLFLSFYYNLTSSSIYEQHLG